MGHNRLCGPHSVKSGTQTCLWPTRGPQRAFAGHIRRKVAHNLVCRSEATDKVVCAPLLGRTRRTILRRHVSQSFLPARMNSWSCHEGRVARQAGPEFTAVLLELVLPDSEVNLSGLGNCSPRPPHVFEGSVELLKSLRDRHRAHSRFARSALAETLFRPPGTRAVSRDTARPCAGWSCIARSGRLRPRPSRWRGGPAVPGVAFR